MLNISIVLYHPDWQGRVLPLVHELLRIHGLGSIYLIDNSEEDCAEEGKAMETMEAMRAIEAMGKVRYIHNEKNLGYGTAHNIAIRESVYDQVPYHLVLNDDILLHAEDVEQLENFMSQNPQVGHVMPHVVYPNGETQHLCKLLPTPMDVLGRRILPARWMARRNARYELHHLGYDRMLNVPYLSGCFMLLRTEAVLRAGLFDERFFMYPEDIDLTRRIHRDYLTLYVPDVTIVHNHARGSYHSMRLLWIHIVNMCRYFNKWGWFYDPERRLVNRLTLEQG